MKAACPIKFSPPGVPTLCDIDSKRYGSRKLSTFDRPGHVTGTLLLLGTWISEETNGRVPNASPSLTVPIS